MKTTYAQFGFPVYLAERIPEILLQEPTYSEAYRCAFLNDDTGIVYDYCMNTSAWD